MPVQRIEDANAMRPGVALEADAAIVVLTSGSTGTPKGVMLPASSLLASARATRERLGAPMRWYSPLPLHYVAGLMTLARAFEAGTEPVSVSSDLHDLPPAGLVEPRAVSLVPTQLHRVLEDPDLTERLAGFDAVLLGGAPAGRHLLERARERGLTVVTTYGMSETCGGCVYDGIPLDGVDVDLEPITGRVRIGGPTLFSGYRLDPEQTAESLQQGHLLTRDRGQWHEGRLHILGRVDDVVISGGVNVDLAEVQRVTSEELDHPAAVVGVPDEEWGTRVVLALETGRDEALDPLPWRETLAAAGLGRPALPRQVIGMVRLPRTESGKIDRRAIAQLAQD